MKGIPFDTKLETSRLYIETTSLEDIEFVWSATRYEGFSDGLTWGPPTDKEILATNIKNNINAWKDGTAYVFTIKLSQANTSVGRIVLRQTNIPAIWSLGFWIHPDHWNKGYATEAGIAVLKFGFIELKASKITTAHAIWNLSSKKVIEKLGFNFIRENPNGFLKHGLPVAEHEYSIDYVDFLTQ